jgi:hypothetical protein
MKIMPITNTAKLYTKEGFLRLENVEIERITEDEYSFIRIGRTLHRAEDVQISEGRLDSVGGWYLTFN